MTDWFPSLAFTRPKITPADPVVMLFEPFDHYDVFSCVLLLVYFLLGLDSPGSIDNCSILLLAEVNGVFPAPPLLSLGSRCEHDVKESLFGKIVVEKDTL